MKKIVLAFNGENFPDAALEFAVRLNEVQPVLLTGVFIPQATYSYLWTPAAAASGPLYHPLLEEVDSGKVDENIQKFESVCKGHNLKYRARKDVYDFALPELVRETRFADLLILDSQKFNESISKEEQSSHLKDLLQETECPVLVVSEKFQYPQKNVLAYDGSNSSVYAIKQFAYLFPELANNETLLVFSKNQEEVALPDEELIYELVSHHFKNVLTLTLTINPKKYFSAWLSEQSPPILVSGSFGRSRVSQLFRKSFVTDVIAEHQLPVFIAHR
jgi:hypothetical protein